MNKRSATSTKTRQNTPENDIDFYMIDTHTPVCCFGWPVLYTEKPFFFFETHQPNHTEAIVFNTRTRQQQHTHTQKRHLRTNTENDNHLGRYIYIYYKAYVDYIVYTRRRTTRKKTSLEKEGAFVYFSLKTCLSLF